MCVCLCVCQEAKNVIRQSTVTLFTTQGHKLNKLLIYPYSSFFLQFILPNFLRVFDQQIKRTFDLETNQCILLSP